MLFKSSEQGSAVDAKSYAQWLAFSPFAFYASVALRDMGILQALSDASRKGASLQALAASTQLTEYAVSVLLDFGVHFDLVQKMESGYSLGKVGHFILHDEMTRVNMNFTRDICYKALPFLEESLRTLQPAGLHTLGPWKTLYEGLSSLPEPEKSSWFEFDHFYSDRAFDELLPIVFAQPVKNLLDVGGNTGRWAVKCLQHNQDVVVTLMDLPQQLAEAKKNIESKGLGDRAQYHSADLLDESQSLYRGADVIWMSQFLDCFSSEQICSILQRTAEVMSDATALYIVELFPDRQAFPAAAMSLDATSLYFTSVANGNSRMYQYQQFMQCLEVAGLRVEEEFNDIGVGHTVLRCRRADALAL